MQKRTAACSAILLRGDLCVYVCYIQCHFMTYSFCISNERVACMPMFDCCEGFDFDDMKQISMHEMSHFDGFFVREMMSLCE